MKEFIKRDLLSKFSPIKDVDSENNVVTGYLSKFGNLNSQGTRMREGCFTKSLKENGVQGTDRIKHLYQHSMFDPIGTYNILQEDSDGLYFEAQISKTRLGKDVIQLYLDGVLEEHSIGFVPLQHDDEWFTDVKLLEGSSVTLGANAQAKGTIEGHAQKLEDALHNGEYHDYTYDLIQYKLKELKTALEKSPEQEDQAEDVKASFADFNSKLELKHKFKNYE